MSFLLNEQHFAHFLDEMPETREEKEASLAWQRRQKIKLRILAFAIAITLVVMVYVAMLILSSISPRASESSSSTTSSSAINILSPTMVPTTELLEVPRTSENPSETPSSPPSTGPDDTNWPSLNPSLRPTDTPTPVPTQPPTTPPTQKPTPLPTPSPSKAPTFPPTQKPIPLPTLPPTKPPTRKPTPLPSPRPTKPPTFPPTQKVTPFPSKPPTKPPKPPTSLPTTMLPTDFPSEFPSIENVSTIKQTAAPTPPKVDELLETNFLVIGDIPYSFEDEVTLQQHVANIRQGDLEFLIHVGDIRNGADRADCTLEEFQKVANILLESPIPVFIVPGDNEYNDCPNFEESFENWLKVFGEFESNWDLPFEVWRDQERPENFYFVYNKVLYIGLNIVGGENTDIIEWETRLKHNFEWTKMLVNTFVLQQGAFSVVIIGHADPRQAHATFFDPLRAYMEDDLNNQVPFLYLNGDRHYFQFDKWSPNFHRVMVEGSRKEPPLQMTFSVPRSRNHEVLQIEDLYSYERFPHTATER